MTPTTAVERLSKQFAQYQFDKYKDVIGAITKLKMVTQAAYGVTLPDKWTDDILEAVVNLDAAELTRCRSDVLQEVEGVINKLPDVQTEEFGEPTICVFDLQQQLAQLRNK